MTQSGLYRISLVSLHREGSEPTWTIDRDPTVPFPQLVFPIFTPTLVLPCARRVGIPAISGHTCTAHTNTVVRGSSKVINASMIWICNQGDDRSFEGSFDLDRNKPKEVYLSLLLLISIHLSLG